MNQIQFIFLSGNMYQAMLKGVSSTLNYLSTNNERAQQSYDWVHTNIGQTNVDKYTWQHIDSDYQAAAEIIREARPLAELQILLNRGKGTSILLNIRDTIGYSLLQTAIILNREDVVQYLVEKGADLNAPICGRPLHLAMRLGKPHLVRLLLKLGADPHLKSAVCYPQEHISSSSQYDPRIKHWSVVCLGDNAHSHSGDQMAHPALIFALIADNVECINVFLESCSGHNITNTWLLQKAARYGALKCLNYFSNLVPMSDVNKCDSESMLPLQYAVMWGKPYMEILLKAGANFTTTVKQEMTLLHFLFSTFHSFYEDVCKYPMFRSIDCCLSSRLEFLLKCGLSMLVNRLDANGMTVLLHLIKNYNLIINTIKCKINPQCLKCELSTMKKGSLTDCSCKQWINIHEELQNCVDILLKNGTNTNVRCRDGSTCLHLFAEISNSRYKSLSTNITNSCSLSKNFFSNTHSYSTQLNILKLLLKGNADPNAETFEHGISVAHTYVFNCILTLPVYNLEEKKKTTNTITHLSPRTLTTLLKYGCNFRKKSTKIQMCWIDYVLQKLGNYF